MFKVSLRRSHPLGVFHRAGMEFTREGRLLDKVPAAVRSEPWLIVEPVEPAEDALAARRGRPRKDSDAAAE